MVQSTRTFILTYLLVAIIIFLTHGSTAAPQRNVDLCKPPYEITYQLPNETSSYYSSNPANSRTLVRPGRKTLKEKENKYCLMDEDRMWKENANCGIHVRQWRKPPYRLHVTVKGGQSMCYKTITHVKGMLIRNCYYTPWAIKVLDLPRGGVITVEKRILYDEPGDQELEFTYGNDTWFSSDDRCSVGKWDDGEHRDMDCRFAC